MVIGAVDLTGVALVITSVATLLGVLVTARVTLHVRNEVRTSNELTIGQLAAAGETRRAEDIPHDERTRQEQRHIDQSPDLGALQGDDQR